jgi:outer membrane protein assembly factor BamB
MKLKILSLTTLLFIGAAVLSACTGGATVASSWPGLTTDADTAYVAYNRSVHAINLANGTQKWQFPAEPDNKITFYSDPTISPDGQLIVGGYNKILYSLDPATGLLNWEFTNGENHYIAPPLAADQGIYAPNSDDTIYALDLAGTLRWKFASDGEVWAQPITDQDCECLYLSSMEHFLFSLNPEDGSIIWQSEQLGGSIVGVPALSPEKVLYVGTFGSELIALNAQDGEVIWRVPTDGWVWSGPTLVEDRLYLGDMDGNFYALSAKDGSTIWKITSDKLGGPIIGSPLVDTDTIYIGTEVGKKEGNLIALDTSGNIKWKQTVGGPIYPSPRLTGDLILVAPMSADELLIAFTKDGAKKWSFIPEK